MPIYDTATALIVVDMQNDFADPAGRLSVNGGSDVLPYVNRQVRLARDAGALVAYTQDWHPEHTPHFAIDGGIWPVHCVRDTWGAELHPDLEIAGPVVRKGSNGEDGYSGFTVRDQVSGATIATGLEGRLRERGIGAVAVTGLATDYCVRATVLDALALGFATTLLADGVRAVDLEEGDGDRAIDEMRTAGARVEGTADDPAAEEPAAASDAGSIQPDDS